MRHELPSEEDVRTTIQEVFKRCQKERPDRIFSALVALVQTPLSKDDSQIISRTPDYFDREMCEICDFSNQMSGFIRTFPQSELPEKQKIWLDSTFKTMVYCHIIEADLPYLILLNLLRVLSGLTCDFTFYERELDDRIKENRDKEQKKRCRFPEGKIEQINQQDRNLNTGIGKILKGVHYSRYRDAFAHSQYFIDQDGSFTCTGSLTGMAPETTVGITKSLDLLNPNEIDSFYRIVITYLQTFVECYKEAISPFQDGNFHKHELSGTPLMWDTVREQWTWLS